MASAPPRFAVDRMLGRLAVWLRLIGQDATCGSHLTGQTLIRHARNEKRMIVTRDRWLLRQHNMPALLFIDSDHFRSQLHQVVATCKLDPFAHIFTRCSRCNEAVAPIGNEEVRGHVPDYVLATQEHFVRCPRCRRIYWPATHYERVRDELRRIGFQSPA